MTYIDTYRNWKIVLVSAKYVDSAIYQLKYIIYNKPNLLYLCIHFQKTKDHISTTMGSKILEPRTLKEKESNIIIVG